MRDAAALARRPWGACGATDDRWLYLKFAGETLIDVTLTSFKEVGND